MIGIEVALKAEASPLIKTLKLTPLEGNHPFPIWQGDGIVLTVSGVGRVRAGAALGYVAGIFQNQGPFGWLNISIAGHSTLPVGTAIFAHKIIDGALGKSFFPSFAFTPLCQTEVVETVDQPAGEYLVSHVYDMEAAGFYMVAAKLTFLELIAVCKVISDNQKNPFQEVTKRKIEELISSKIDLIVATIEKIGALVKEIAMPALPLFDEYVKRWHFTACERVQLKKLLHQWHLLQRESPPLLQTPKKGKEVLELLTKELS
jgi:hypothetical protein